MVRMDCVVCRASFRRVCVFLVNLIIIIVVASNCFRTYINPLPHFFSIESAYLLTPVSIIVETSKLVYQFLRFLSLSGMPMVCPTPVSVTYLTGQGGMRWGQ